MALIGCVWMGGGQYTQYRYTCTCLQNENEIMWTHVRTKTHSQEGIGILLTLSRP